MKTLIFSPYSPYPAVFGGAIRTYHLIKMFAQFSRVTLITYVGRHADAAALQHLETLCEHVVAIDNAPTEAKRKWLRQARALLGTQTFQYYSFYSRNFRRASEAALRQQQFDYIAVEQSQMGYLRCHQPGAGRALVEERYSWQAVGRLLRCHLDEAPPHPIPASAPFAFVEDQP